MEINVRVTLETSPALERLIGAMAGATATADPVPAETGNPEKVQKKETGKPERETVKEKAGKPVPVQETDPEPETGAGDLADLGEAFARRWKEEVKQAMDYRFRELLGEDWQNATGPALTEKKQITKWYRTIATQLGSPDGKPSTVPPARQDEFLGKIKDIMRDAEGKIDYRPF